jgi:general secretion pathway protein G
MKANSLVVFSGALVFAVAVARATIARSHTENAKVEAAKSDILTLKSALNLFRLNTGRYPTTKEGLNALVVNPKVLCKTCQGPYLSHKVPNDPWGHGYDYRKTGADSFVLKSYGSDGKPGGTCDATDLIGGTN